MLGKIGVTPTPAAAVQKLELGPDALDEDVDLDAFRDRLKARRAAVKTVLMDQTVLAGIGNECSDEILFQAAMNPQKRINKFETDEVARLFGTMRSTLRTLVQCRLHDDELPDIFLNKRRSTEAPCPRCGGTVVRLTVGGRKGYACTACQGIESAG